MPVFSTVLIANRGEIAVRIQRTLRRMGIGTAAVYSDADAGAPHVREADVAMRIGPAAASASYLSVDRIIAAAAAVGADAVHPGYGFLAENPALARACEAAGIAFLGPSAAVIELLGDKARAKRCAVEAGVPVVPGIDGTGMNDEELVAAATGLGMPVLVKPSAGGGGKGMRYVTAAADLPDAIRAARREAASSFGDDTLLVERFISEPRHIEMQVLADQHGSVIHLGERECSLQRRHQKVIEEAPSPLLTPQRRARMGQAAVDLTRSVGYVGAGTVEFIVSGSDPDSFAFLEVNTRLQVEHPVTEFVTGLDLVELQVRIGGGEPLPLTQDDVTVRGHAVEARVYAEDPSNGFLPTGGRITHWAPAAARTAAGSSVRTDAGVATGSVVTSDYDPMLAKVIAHADDRRSALRALDGALARTALLGLRSNVAFLRALLQHPLVVAGELDTGLIERHLTELSASPAAEPALAAAAVLLAVPAGKGPWEQSDAWRPSGAPAPIVRRLLVTSEGPQAAPRYVTLTGSRPAFKVEVDTGWSAAVRLVQETANELLLSIDDRLQRWTYSREDAGFWLGLAGCAWAVRDVTDDEEIGSEAAAHDGELRSPMPGTVVAVPGENGMQVVSGQPVVVVEAMKMEYALVAPFNGTVEGLTAGVGDQVAVGALLARVTA